MDLKGSDSNAGYANRMIWGKLIKNKIFKSVLEYIGPKYTEDYLLDFEDTIMTVSLFHISNSYYYMDQCGYYTSSGECEISFPLLKSKKCIPKNLRINTELDSFKYLKFLLNKDFSFVYSILDEIIKSNLNSKKRKNKIEKIKEKLLKKETIINLKKYS